MWTPFASELTPTFNRAFQSARALAGNLDSAALTASCALVYTSTKVSGSEEASTADATSSNRGA
eukprot:1254515-Pyramimonas_sp.AAC.1